MPEDIAQPAAPERVSSLELFFDLVFVFTITQVSTILVRSPDWGGVGRAALVLTVIYWMYGGYAWLTNLGGPDSAPRRGVLLAGMIAFFITALAVPDAFGSTGIAFGAAYLAVNVVHSLGFLVFVGRDALRTIARLLPRNGISAGVILASGWVHGDARWAMWLAAIAMQLGTSSFFTRGNWTYRINAGHFAERHGLVILIVLGESLLSIGLAGVEEHVTTRIVAGVVAGFAAVAAFWYVYFGGDDERAAAALEDVPEVRRPEAALTAYFAAHLVMIFGVLAVAAGARHGAQHLATHAATPAEAALVAGGAAGYLVGVAAFRLALRFASPAVPAATAVVCAAAYAIGRTTNLAVELACVACVVLAGRWAGERAGALPRRDSGR